MIVYRLSPFVALCNLSDFDDFNQKMLCSEHNIKVHLTLIIFIF